MRSIIKSKVFAVLLCISMLMTLVPAINVQAASDDQVKASISADSQTVNEDGTVKVTISLEGIPYQGKVNPTDVILVIDRSNSMTPDMEKMKEAAKAFIDSVDTSIHRIGIVVYTKNVDSYGLSTDKDKLKEYVDCIATGSITNISEAINESINLLKNRRNNAQGAIVLMTDGASNYNRLDELTRLYKQTGKDIPIFSIMFGEAEEEQLQDIADLTNAKIFDGKTNLLEAFKQVRGYN